MEMNEDCAHGGYFTRNTRLWEGINWLKTGLELTVVNIYNYILINDYFYFNRRLTGAKLRR